LQIPVELLLQVDPVANHRTPDPPRKRGRKPRQPENPSGEAPHD
jgi:hypothetical protein